MANEVTQSHREWLEGRRAELLGYEDNIQDCEALLRFVNSTRGFIDCNMPPASQIELLGLARHDILALKGRRTLDIACGSQARLVNWLREVGVEAEGIDPTLNNGVPYLMKQWIGGFGTADGRIPREDGTYQIVTANLCSPMITGFSDIPGLKVEPESIAKATGILFEALRVTASSGKFVCWPAITRESYLQPILRAERYKLERTRTFEGVPQEITDTIPEEINRLLLYRSVIRKTRSS